jgi:hypothetical protein
MDGWQYGLILVGLLFVMVIAAVLCICAQENSAVIKYRDINQPGAFKVGKDVK